MKYHITTVEDRTYGIYTQGDGQTQPEEVHNRIIATTSELRYALAIRKALQEEADYHAAMEIEAAKEPVVGYTFAEYLEEVWHQVPEDELPF